MEADLQQNVIAYDVGTSSVKAVAIDQNGQVLGYCEKPYPISYPHPGWAEQSPQDYWQAICDATKSIIQTHALAPQSIRALVFGTQAMGIIPVEKNGTVLHNNISWVDGRAEIQARQLMRKFGGKAIFKKIVGIELTGKDVIPKLIWLKQEIPTIYQRTYKFLDVNGFLKFKATGKMVAEWSGACSYAFDLKTKDWVRIFFKIASVDLQKLPDLVKSTDIVGPLTSQAAEELGFGAHTDVAVFGGCDDTQSATLGSTAIDEGDIHVYLGTSAWMAISTAKIWKFAHGAVTLQSGDPSKNIIVGITESAGANVEWYMRQFFGDAYRPDTAKDFYQQINEAIAKIPAGSEHLLFTPWFLGERCPVSTTTTRGTIFNLSFEHGRTHIARALFEGIGYNLRWVLSNYRRDFKVDPQCIRVIGGGSLSSPWMQILADILQVPIETMSNPKLAGAVGTAMVAFVGLGWMDNFSEIKRLIQPTATFTPNSANFAIYDEMYLLYRKLFSKLKYTYKGANKRRFTFQ
jgi:xylulokinase